MIHFENVSKRYPNGFEALKHVDLSIEQGEFVAIIGLSGAVKSTLIRTINRMHDITEGRLTVDDVDVMSLQGKALRSFRRRIGMIFQSFNLITRTTVIKNVLTAFVPDMPWWRAVFGIYTKEEKLKALEALDKVGILDKAFVRADQLSGGQQQRVALARTLAQDPQIILADEPVASLDPVTAKQVMDDFRHINEDMGITILINIHHVELALQYAERVIGIRAGEVVYDGPAAKVDQAVLDTIYYRSIAEDRINAYAEATVNGMRDYYSRHPDGLFEFYPFAGINPKVHSLYFLEDFLSRYINTSHRMHDDHQIDEKPFYGIKVYPPLGFEPWPDDEETREKHELLYSFCEKHDIPIITHADDQGIRSVTAEKAWQFTDPASWRIVLEHHPGLKIDFAHFGKQYAIRNKGLSSIAMRLMRLPDSPWFLTIASLMEDFPNVYADLSFSGCAPSFYKELYDYIDVMDEDPRERFLRRILFGSDFAVNLLKVESYTEYYSIFESSPFDDDTILSFASSNPLSFLGINETDALKKA